LGYNFPSFENTGRSMFGLGFTEIILIAIVAIIFLGPEKLPTALVDIAKFFRAFKKVIDDAKDSLDKEVKLSEIKQEALSYKESIEKGVSGLSDEFNIDRIEEHNKKVLEKEQQEKLTQNASAPQQDGGSK